MSELRPEGDDSLAMLLADLAARGIDVLSAEITVSGADRKAGRHLKTLRTLLAANLGLEDKFVTLKKRGAGGARKDSSEKKQLKGRPDPGRPPRLGPDARLRMQFDGSSLGNPGKAGIGVVFTDPRDGKEVYWISRYIGDNLTNNQAEYMALIAGIECAVEMDLTQLEVLGDSKLVVEQVLGNYRVKNEKLKPLYDEVIALRMGLPFSIGYVPREQNKVADELAQQASNAGPR